MSLDSASGTLLATFTSKFFMNNQQFRGLPTSSPLDSSRRLEEVVCWVVSRREKWDPVLSLSRMVFFFSFDIDLEHSEVP